MRGTSVSFGVIRCYDTDGSRETYSHGGYDSEDNSRQPRIRSMVEISISVEGLFGLT
jgi:hypothetical protein